MAETAAARYTKPEAGKVSGVKRGKRVARLDPVAVFYCPVPIMAITSIPPELKSFFPLVSLL